MKYVIFFILMMPMFGMSQSSGSLVKFDSETIHLGKIKKGEKVKGVYSFTNISKEPVQIDIVSTCDCTEAKWTTSPIKPGEKGLINFIFDSTKKDAEEQIEIDVYFINNDPKTGNPVSAFLSYTYEYL